VLDFDHEIEALLGLGRKDVEVAQFELRALLVCNADEVEDPLVLPNVAGDRAVP
jgi:hypothetical protein